MIKIAQLVNILQSTGFSEKEALVYITLLELSEALPSAIARKAGVKRSTAYLILDSLQKKGLVSRTRNSQHLYFQALDPQIFLQKQRAKQTSLQTSTEQLAEALPELQALHSSFIATPQMSVFEGKEGLIQIMEDTLTTSTELLCWADPSTVFGLLEDYYPGYIKKKVERKIWLRGIFCHDDIGMTLKKHGEEELREVYLIPKERFPFKNEINIYDDKVAIISHQDEVGVIIQNQAIADTQRAIFELGFEYAKLLERDLLTDEDKEYLGIIKEKSKSKRKSRPKS